MTTCTFSPNGAFVLSGSTGGDIRVWDALYGHGKQLAFQAEAHDLGVTCAAFSPSYTEGNYQTHTLISQLKAKHEYVEI